MDRVKKGKELESSWDSVSRNVLLMRAALLRVNLPPPCRGNSATGKSAVHGGRLAKFNRVRALGHCFP